VTEWKRDENGDEVPFGQKMLLVNGEEVPILELRDLQVTVAQAAP
jgi:type VI secretion system protein ImpE